VSTRELWLFLHLTGAIVWVGGAGAVQVFGILTKRAGDPARTAFFAGNVAVVVKWVFLPAALVVLVSGFLLRGEEHVDYGEPFILFGLVGWAAVAAFAFGYLGPELGRSARRLAEDGPSPALGLHMRNLIWASRVLLLILFAIVFMMTVKIGTPSG